MNKSHGLALPIEELVAQAYFSCTRPSNSSATLQPSKRPAGLGIVVVFPGYSHCLVVRCPFYGRSDADGVAISALHMLDRYRLGRLVIQTSVDIEARVRAIEGNPLLTNARSDLERLEDEIGKRVTLPPRRSKRTLTREGTRVIARGTKAARAACDEALAFQARDPDRFNSTGGINRILGWHEEDVDLAQFGLS